MSPLATNSSALLADFESPSPQVRRSRNDRIADYRTLWEHRRTLGRSALIGLVLSTIIAFLLPKQYRSTTRLMPPDNNNSGMSLLAAAAAARAVGSLGGIAGNLLGLNSSGVLFVGILQSRTVQDDLITKFDLKDVYKHKRWSDTRNELISRTDISEDRKNGIINIEVTDRDPRRAAAMAQEYVDELNRVVNQLSTSSARRERLFLEDRLSAVRKELEDSEKNFSEFASKNTAIDIKEQSRAMIGAAAALEGQLIAGQTLLQGLKQVYADGSIQVREAQARIDELRRQLGKLSGKAGDSAADSTTDSSWYPSVKKLPILGVTYADLYRDMRVNETVFGILTQQYELAKVQEAKEIPTVKVLDPPDIPEKHSFPHRLWIMVGGTLLFAVISGGWILSQERWRHVESSDPGKVLALEIFHTLKHVVRAELPEASPDEHWSGAGEISNASEPSQKAKSMLG